MSPVQIFSVKELMRSSKQPLSWSALTTDFMSLIVGNLQPPVKFPFDRRLIYFYNDKAAF